MRPSVTPTDARTRAHRSTCRRCSCPRCRSRSRWRQQRRKGLEAGLLVTDGLAVDEPDVTVVREFGGTGIPVYRAERGRCRRRHGDHVSEPSYRSGFVSLVGRPNAGKSTLTNALVGQKVAITSSRPQTTRHAVRGIIHRADAPAGHRRHPGPAQAAHAAGGAAQRPGQGDLGRGRRHRRLPAGRRAGRTRRPLPGVGAGQGQANAEAGRRDQDRPRHARPARRAPDVDHAAGRGDRGRVGRDRPGLRRVRRPGRPARATCWSRGSPRANRSTPRASSPTSRRRPWSPS